MNMNLNHEKAFKIEGTTMTISINATDAEILEATKIAEEKGLELEFILDEF